MNFYSKIQMTLRLAFLACVTAIALIASGSLYFFDIPGHKAEIETCRQKIENHRNKPQESSVESLRESIKFHEDQISAHSCTGVVTLILGLLGAAASLKAHSVVRRVWRNKPAFTESPETLFRRNLWILAGCVMVFALVIAGGIAKALLIGSADNDSDKPVEIPPEAVRSISKIFTGAETEKLPETE